MTLRERVKVKAVRLLSDDWYVLKKSTFDYRRRDGTWQELSRETYDRGNGAVILLFNPEGQSVVLTKQFRYPAFVNGYDEVLIEAPAGLLDQASPEDRIRAEVEEETGYRVANVEKVFEAFMSPGSVTEKLYFFIASYSAEDKQSSGGGNRKEGEDIEVFEIPLHDAMLMIDDGRICDAKTIMLLQNLYIRQMKSQRLNTERP